MFVLLLLFVVAVVFGKIKAMIFLICCGESAGLFSLFFWNKVEARGMCCAVLLCCLNVVMLLLVFLLFLVQLQQWYLYGAKVFELCCCCCVVIFSTKCNKDV
jgi:hypothetical protein